jgi:hypothetical protein
MKQPIEGSYPITPRKRHTPMPTIIIATPSGALQLALDQARHASRMIQLLTDSELEPGETIEERLLAIGRHGLALATAFQLIDELARRADDSPQPTAPEPSLRSEVN